MKKYKNKLVVLLVSTVVCFSFLGISCQPVKPVQKEEPIGFACNNHLHLNSIPRPCKRIEIYPNGSVGLQNVVITKPNGEKLPIKGEPASYYFTPDEPGEYHIDYEYAYTNHFEHLTVEDSKTVTWEKGNFVFNVPNYPIPEGYLSVTSTNQLVKIYYPLVCHTQMVDLILEIKPLPNVSIVALDIKDFAIFPEAYTLTGTKEVRILFQQDRKFVQSGIYLDLLDKEHHNEKIDSLLLKQDIPFVPLTVSELAMNGEELTQFLSHSVYYLENGDLKLWDFINNQKTVLLSGKDFAFFDISPDRKHIAISTKVDTFLCDFAGKDLKMVGASFIRPRFVTNDELMMTSSATWESAKSARYGNITLTNNVFAMPVQIYYIQKAMLSPKILVNVFLGERYGMYFPTVADYPVDILPFDRGQGKFLFKIISPGLDQKWVLFNGATVEEYRDENVPWIPTKAYVFREFSFEGDIKNAILRKVTYSNEYSVIFVETNYAELSLPQEQGRYLAYVRTVGDHLSAPHFYIETFQELCVFDKLTLKTYRLPVQNIAGLILGAK
jgi:hypothetical protein